MEIKRFLKPNLIKISLAFLCLGLTLKYLVPLMSLIHIVPCKIFGDSGAGFGFCSINPVSDIDQVDSYYLGFMIGDNLYVGLYLISIALFIPYLMSCLMYCFYFKYFKNDDRCKKKAKF